MAKPYDLRERSFLFALEVARFANLAVNRGFIVRRFAGQLADAAGSVGANLQEAKSGQTKPDFITKYFVALKEAREAGFWLRLIVALQPNLQAQAAPLRAEASELTAILTACVKTARANKNRGPAGS